MKRLSKYILEQRREPIDDQWLNDEKPVMTKDGRPVIILSFNFKETPNIIKGQVKMDDKLFDYEWLDNGICIKAVDRNGNPKLTTDNDILVKNK
jgi:hypothetical protein